MSKGYSKEIMEALFKEAKVEQDREEARETAKKQKQKQQQELFKYEVLQAQLMKAEEEIAKLDKRLSRMRIWVIVSIVIALISAAMGLNESLKELILLMP